MLLPLPLLLLLLRRCEHALVEERPRERPHRFAHGHRSLQAREQSVVDARERAKDARALAQHRCARRVHLHEELERARRVRHVETNLGRLLLLRGGGGGFGVRRELREVRRRSLPRRPHFAHQLWNERESAGDDVGGQARVVLGVHACDVEESRSVQEPRLGHSRAALRALRRKRLLATALSGDQAQENLQHATRERRLVRGRRIPRPRPLPRPPTICQVRINQHR
mmetsp:Transcript_30750/g.100074  ORF Transcript_30750/g.100074 Transcript_30750/m.100074 type:complete len:226 (+) Transcript_30750:2292-2969(+)